jgi:hypothetical protein
VQKKVNPAHADEVWPQREAEADIQCAAHKEAPMRRLQGCLAIVVLLTAMPLYAQSKAKVQNVPEIPFDSVPNALKLPDNLYLGEGIGVATNSKGHVYVYTRSGATRLFEFDQNGTFVKEIGKDLYGFLFAHAVRVDKDDNILAVDEGSTWSSSSIRPARC